LAMTRLIWFASALLLVTGCNLKKDKSPEGGEKVEFSSALGDLKVDIKNVAPKATGLSVYPGARLKERRADHDENQADVNINTPWFGVKVVAVTYLTDDSLEKVW